MSEKHHLGSWQIHWVSSVASGLEGPWRSRVLVAKVVLLAIGLVLLATTSSPVVSGDGYVRFLAVPSLDRLGEIEVSKYSWVQPFVSWPLLYFAQLTAVPAITAIAYFNVVIVIGLGTVLTVLLARRYGWNLAVNSALILIGTSMLPHHVQQYYGEVFTAFLLAVGVLLPKRFHFVGVLLIALAGANSPIVLIPIGLAAFVLLIGKKSWRMLAGWIIGVGVALGENFLKFGSFTDTPYRDEPGFVYPVLLGLLSVVMSFGKGLIFYIPGFFLVLSARVREVLALSRVEWYAAITFFAAFAIVYSTWYGWWGGQFWGPRFFLLWCLPAAVFIAAALEAPVRSRVFPIVVVVILFVSVWVGVNGFVYGERDMEACYSTPGVPESTCWYDPSYSALWRPFVTGSWQGLPLEPGFPFVVWQIAMALFLALVYALSIFGSRNRQLPPLTSP